MDKLSLIKQFICVVEQGGFSAAAQHQGLSPSTLSKAMARLEEHLQLTLFHRSTRQVRLTEAGRQYLATSQSVVQQLEQCEHQLQLSNDEPSGLVRVNVAVSYGRRYLVPLLAQFHRRYRDIRLELSFNDSYVDMLEQGIDLTIRSGQLQDQNLIARKLSPIDFLICAAPDYLERAGAPANADAFSQHPWIRFRYRQSGRLMPIMAQGADHDPGQQFIVDDGETLAELCAEGVGLTQLPHFIARDWLRDGRLKTLFPHYRPADNGVFAVYPKREYLPNRVRVLVEYLQSEMERQGESANHCWTETLTTD